VPIYKYVNKDFFKKWTNEMAYVLGFFAADGNIIRNKRGAHFLTLEICDLDILEKIRFAMNSEHKISVKINKNPSKHRDAYKLQIGSKDIYYDLVALGFSYNKTKNLSVPLVPKKVFSDFVRGYFDGDGNVWVGRVHKDRKTPLLAIQTVLTSCSRGFLGDLMERLEEYGIKGKLRQVKNYYRLVFSIQSSIRLCSFLYPVNDKQILCLERKKSIFDSYLRKRMRP